MADMITEKSKAKLVYESYSDEEEKEDGSGSDLRLYLGRLNIGPKKKLLVLGFSGFLCYRVFRYDKSNLPSSLSHDAEYGNYLEFVKFCLERFEVGIWSSSKEYNLDNSLDCMMKGLKNRLLFAWKCTNSGFSSREKKDKPLFFKDLYKLWEDNNSILPKSKGQFSSSNTLLDDKPYKALLNPNHNAIFPTEYNVDDIEDNALGHNSELRMYLEKLVDADEVPSFVQENLFGQAPITPTHSHWNYYSKVVPKFRKTT